MKNFLITILVVSSFTLQAQEWMDASFGTNGIVTTNFPLNGLDEIQKLLTQPDGKIIAIGNTRNATNFYDIGIARYLENGTLDPSFGTAGVDGITILDIQNEQNTVTDAFLQSDGKFVVLSSLKYANNTTDIVLTRFLSNGTVDTSFGTNGSTIFGINTNPEDNEAGYGILKLADDRILVVGTYEEDTATTPVYTLLTVFTTNGSVDVTFGTNGYLTFNIGNDNYSYADKAVQLNDGKIVFCGTYTSNVTNDDNAFVAKINLDGSLDTTFANNGVFTLDLNTALSLYSYDSAVNLAVSTDGKIGVVGFTATDTYYDYLFFVLQANGTLDPTFSINGYHVWDHNGDANTLFSIASQEDGKWLVSGDYFSQNGADTEGKFYVSRLNADGNFDATFGVNGAITFDINATYLYTQSSTMAIDSQGRIILGGFWYNNSSLDFAVARLLTPELLEETIFFNEKHANLQLINPINKNIIIFNTSNNNERMNVMIYNSLGNLVYSKENIFLISNEVTIPFDAYSKGVYYIQIQAIKQQKKQTYKILKI
ncbi:T9SS type A sorting domain-containing protein [Flavobacterium sp. NRK F7]|uniref:T9SS type A sorting domain-containing protein n=1 Tax=Flavobacterium sp. NRK F7 TaxID=2954930 RepID=UPI002090DBCB|nr:T9SS type A sorting domain-containing protein [Flavobacterium sp. NRK F7]MCO6163849.1 T9SS type A sorting domain-containing protein [Flavobacterium sp. NRK F7]